MSSPPGPSSTTPAACTWRCRRPPARSPCARDRRWPRRSRPACHSRSTRPVVEPIVGRRTGRLGKELPPRADAFVDDDSILGQHGAKDRGDGGRSDCAGRKRGPAWRRDPGGRGLDGTELHGQSLKGGFHILVDAGQLAWIWHPRASAGWACRDRQRTQPARAPHEHQVAGRPHHAESPLDHIGDALDLDTAGAALNRVLAPSVRMPHPVLAAILPANSRQRWRRASPPISRVALSPLRSIAAAALSGIVRHLAAALEAPSRRCRRPHPRPYPPAR